MFDILVLLAILALLFGVSGMREIVFGTFGFIGWIIAISIAISIFGKICDAFKDNRTDAQKKADAERLAAEEQARQKAIATAHAASAERQKAWLNKHPICRALVNLSQNHTIITVALFTILCFAVMALVAVIIAVS